MRPTQAIQEKSHVLHRRRRRTPCTCPGASVLDSDSDTATLRGELETNLFGTLAVASAFADRLAQRSGVMINIASVASWLPMSGTYGVSKAAVWSATDSMRLELGARGVQVVGVHVGYVDTDMTAGSRWAGAGQRGQLG